MEIERDSEEKERFNEKMRKGNMNRLNWALQWNIPLPEDLLAKIREIGEDEIC